MDFRELRFGIEIETVGRTREVVANAIHSAVGGTVRYVGGGTYDPWEVTDPAGRIWKVMGDASLVNAPPHLRAEVVSPVLEYQDLERLQEVVRAVRARGAKVDDKCGIHVHVDASRFDGKKLGILAKIVYKQEPLILSALGVAQERLQRYTRPIPPSLIAKIERERPQTKEQLNRIWYGYHNTAPMHYDSTRYHGVNLHNVWYRGTIEFHWFEATLHAGKVKAYIQFVLAVAAKALNARGASSQKRTLDPTCARYDFRVFLLRLGFIGEEFKTARKHLLERMTGDSAFKRGRPLPQHDATGDPQKVAADTTSGTTPGAGLDVRPSDFEATGEPGEVTQ
ncbi:MAG: amidoligase family protein [Armatimonadetes bacterium]|nr:amidoligase family protein [Armatimonadota bacterium]